MPRIVYLPDPPFQDDGGIAIGHDAILDDVRKAITEFCESRPPLTFYVKPDDTPSDEPIGLDDPFGVDVLTNPSSDIDWPDGF